MINKVSLTIIISMMAFSLCHAQTLKVTKVQATVDKLYTFAAQQFLGKAMTLTLYDGSVSLKLSNRDAFILREGADGKYTYVESETEKERHIFLLKINTTVGVVTSAELSYNINEVGGQYRHDSWTLTGKRF